MDDKRKAEEIVLSESCYTCSGEGQMYADGKAHYPTENAPTVNCGCCGGSGEIYDLDATRQRIAEALSEARKEAVKEILEEAEKIGQDYACSCLGEGSMGYSTCDLHQAFYNLKSKHQEKGE